MEIGAYLKVLWRDWLARMTGPLSLVLLFVPLLAPEFTAEHLGGSTIVWIISFLCLVVSSYRAWLTEHRGRLAEKLDPLIEDVRSLREFWEEVQYRYRDSELIRFPLAGFSVENWEELHKQLMRLYFWTSLQGRSAEVQFAVLGIEERPQLSVLMNNQDHRRSLNAFGYTALSRNSWRGRKGSHSKKLGVCG